MTYEIRHIADYAFGTLSQAAAVSDTTLNSADFATWLPSGLSTTKYTPLTLQDPTSHVYETVWVNAHTASATSATVVRGKEGTTARVWPSGTQWVVGPTMRDGILPVSTRSALPSDPHVGLRANIQDEQSMVEWSATTGWSSPVRTLAGRLVTTGSSWATGITTVESTLSKLNITGVKTKSGVWYTLNLALNAQFSVAGDSFTVRVRLNAPGGTNIAEWSWISDVGTYTHAQYFGIPWKATADNTNTNFYVSIQRAAGSGAVDINGASRTAFWLDERGADPAWLEVA